MAASRRPARRAASFCSGPPQPSSCAPLRDEPTSRRAPPRPNRPPPRGSVRSRARDRAEVGDHGERLSAACESPAARAAPRGARRPPPPRARRGRRSRPRPARGRCRSGLPGSGRPGGRARSRPAPCHPRSPLELLERERHGDHEQGLDGTRGGRPDSRLAEGAFHTVIGSNGPAWPIRTSPALRNSRRARKATVCSTRERRPTSRVEVETAAARRTARNRSRKRDGRESGERGGQATAPAARRQGTKGHRQALRDLAARAVAHR